MVTYFQKARLLFLNGFQRAVYNNTFHPALKRTFKFVLSYVREYFYKCILQHVFSFGFITGIAQANRHQLACILLKKQTLASNIILYTTFNELLFCQSGFKIFSRKIYFITILSYRLYFLCYQL